MSESDLVFQCPRQIRCSRHWYPWQLENLVVGSAFFVDASGWDPSTSKMRAINDSRRWLVRSEIEQGHDTYDTARIKTKYLLNRLIVRQVNLNHLFGRHPRAPCGKATSDDCGLVGEGIYCFNRSFNFMQNVRRISTSDVPNSHRLMSIIWGHLFLR